MAKAPSFSTRLRTLAQDPPRQRLSFIISPKIPSVSLQVPSQFLKLSIYACEKKRSYTQLGVNRTIKEVILEDDSTYCEVPLARWNLRTEFLTHELSTGPGVAMDLPDDDILSGETEPSPFDVEQNNAADTISRQIETTMNQTATNLHQSEISSFPWAAALAGTLSGAGTAAAYLVSHVQIGFQGIFIQAGPFINAGMRTVTLSSAFSLGAGATMTSFAVGAGVAAAVYFIPWRKLASWFVDKFSQFLNFLKTIWGKIKEGFKFLKSLITSIIRFLKSPAAFARSLFS